MNEFTSYLITAVQDGEDEVLFIECFDYWWMSRNPAQGRSLATEDEAKAIVREAQMHQLEYDEMPGFAIGYVEVKSIVGEVKGVL